MTSPPPMVLPSSGDARPISSSLQRSVPTSTLDADCTPLFDQKIQTSHFDFSNSCSKALKEMKRRQIRRWIRAWRKIDEPPDNTPQTPDTLSPTQPSRPSHLEIAETAAAAVQLFQSMRVDVNAPPRSHMSVPSTASFGEVMKALSTDV
eukprot:CAMPEP_0183770450 /NCGR_PEP_ID=MMETSP0739-20130205/28361_1 /TAXON_ID=385413 /ORGANISM="Thalassiosira miniscula, Strain CCMP1093" /LENGTH=148 /DNA_ID=CAMNT_0026010453 /DNA_START=4 /DNA_END=450 /DNA_ORIENTATION=+